jgi:hypothetical protein
MRERHAQDPRHGVVARHEVLVPLGVVHEHGQQVAGHAAGDALAQPEARPRLGRRRRLARPHREEPQQLLAVVEAEDGRVVGLDETPGLVRRPREERLQVGERRGLEPEVVERRHLARQVLGRRLALGAAERERELAAERRQQARLLLVERAGAPAHDREHAERVLAGAHGNGELGRRLVVRGLERRREPQRPAQRLGVGRERSRAGLRLEHERPVRARRVERRALVAQVALHPPHGELEQPRAPRDRRHVSHERRQPLEARRLPSLLVEGLAAAQERRDRAGEGRQDLHVAVAEAARLVGRAQQADQLALGHERHEHDGLRLGHEADLLREARVERGRVADVRPAAARRPEAAVLGARHVAERARAVVVQAVDGQRGLHRAAGRVVERDADDRRADQARETLREHAVELGGLGDQRPVAADLVQPRQVARARLRLLAAQRQLVVRRLEPQERPHLQDQGGRVDRLVQEVVGAGLVPAPHGHRVAEGRHHDHRQVRAVGLADPRAGLEAAHARQPDVEQHEVEAACRERVEASLSRLRAVGDVAVEAQQVQQRLADVWVVVDDQDLSHGRKGQFRARSRGRQGAELYFRSSEPSSMYPSSAPRDGLALLAEAFRSRRTGVLVVGEGEGAIHVRLEAGQVMALGPPAREGSAAKEPKASDSVQLRLERVLAEIGMRRSPQTARTPDVSASTPLSSASLRERLIASLAEDVRPVRFDDGAPSPDGLVAVSVATEPLILEAVRQMRHDEAVLNAIGDLDQLLVATIALAEERTLTLTEGYLLSRIDGLHSARQVLELVPLDPGDVERTLLGLLLTGRVETRPAPYPRRVPIAPPAPVAPLFAAPPAAFADTRPPEPTLEEAPPVSQATPETAPDSLATGPTVVPVEDEPPVESEPQAEASHIVAEWTNEDVEAARAAVVESVESAEPVEAAPSAAADEALETQTVTIREFERPVPELIPEADEAPGNEAADTPLEGPTVESSAAETPSPAARCRRRRSRSRVSRRGHRRPTPWSTRRSTRRCSSVVGRCWRSSSRSRSRTTSRCWASSRAATTRR